MSIKKYSILCITAALGLLAAAANGYAYSSFGSNVNTLCAPEQPYTGSCTLCHTSSKSDPTPAKDAYLAGGSTLVDYFCPATTSCTDSDGDTFSPDGGECGPVDCNDNDRAINPGAAENCTDKIDNDCDGLIDLADSNAVGCPPPCTDSDGDGYSVEGGNCGPVDCNDSNRGINPAAYDIPNNSIDEDCSGADSVDPTSLDRDGDGYTPAAGDCNDNDPAINPGVVDTPNNGIDENCDGVDSVDSSVVDNDGDGFTPAAGDCNDTDPAVNPAAEELCTDGIDNNCDGLVDTQDPSALDCPVVCTDNDLDSYATEGGSCGQVDCNDSEQWINPGAIELCGDSIDNDCDGLIDEGCDPACPDIDGDGYLDALCGGTDCNDDDASINPGADEVCGNSVDENCNGDSDDPCRTCPDGSTLQVRSAEYNANEARLTVSGLARAATTISLADADTGEILLGDIPVEKGKWRAVIENLGQAPLRIRVITGDGCFVDKELSAPKGKGRRSTKLSYRKGKDRYERSERKSYRDR